VVVEGYQRPVGLFPEAHPESQGELLLLSANTPASLKAQIDLFQDYVTRRPDVWPSDLAYTLAERRDPLPHRAFAVLRDGKFTVVSPATKAPAESPQIYLIFSGQGAQWPEMGKELIQSDPLFRGSIQKMDEILRGVAEPPAWSLIGKYFCTLLRRHTNVSRRTAQAGRD